MRFQEPARYWQPPSVCPTTGAWPSGSVPRQARSDESHRAESGCSDTDHAAGMPSKQSTIGERYTLRPPALNSATSLTTISSGCSAEKSWTPPSPSGAFPGLSSGSPA